MQKSIRNKRAFQEDAYRPLQWLPLMSILGVLPRGLPRGKGVGNYFCVWEIKFWGNRRLQIFGVRSHSLIINRPRSLLLCDRIKSFNVDRSIIPVISTQFPIPGCTWLSTVYWPIRRKTICMAITIVTRSAGAMATALSLVKAANPQISDYNVNKTDL